MKSKRTPTIEEVDEKLQEIAYGPAKQSWPRSAKITVWVMGILLFLASAYIALDATTVPAGDYITDEGDIHLLNRRVPELPDSKQATTKTVREL